jgi:hypothetical protein
MDVLLSAQIDFTAVDAYQIFDDWQAPGDPARPLRLLPAPRLGAFRPQAAPRPDPGGHSSAPEQRGRSAPVHGCGW